MKIRYISAMLAGACLLSGCVLRGKMYPVQGPLAALTPPPVFSAKATGGINPQTFSAVLQDGETVNGTWAVVSTEKKENPQASSASAASKLKSAWDTVYGTGYYNSHILGTQFFASTVLTGSKGTVLTVEIYRQVHATDSDPHAAPEVDIKGVAQDDKGNVYKLVL